MNIKSKNDLQKYMDENLLKYQCGTYAKFRYGDKYDVIYLSTYDFNTQKIVNIIFPYSCQLYEYDCTNWTKENKKDFKINSNKAYNIYIWDEEWDFLPNELIDFEFISEDECIEMLLKMPYHRSFSIYRI
jgi:hypothetical protein